MTVPIRLYASKEERDRFADIRDQLRENPTINVTDTKNAPDFISTFDCAAICTIVPKTGIDARIAAKIARHYTELGVTFESSRGVESIESEDSDAVVKSKIDTLLSS